MTDETRTSWPLVLLIWTTGLLAAMQFAKFSLTFSDLSELYGGTVRAGFLVSVISVTGMLLGSIAGLLIGRVGYKFALLTGLFLGAVFSALQAFLPPFSVLILLRIFEGVSHLAIVVAAPVLLVEITAPRHVAGVMTLWGTFFGVGFLIMAWICAPILVAGGPAALFLVHAGMMASIGTAALVFVPRIKVVPEPLPSAHQIFEAQKAMYRSPFIAAAPFGWIFYTLTFVAGLSVLPDFYGATQPGYGFEAFILNTIPLISIGASLVLGILLLRVLSEYYVVLIGFLVGAVAGLLLGIAPSFFSLSCLAIAWGLIQAGSFALIPALNTGPKSRAHCYGAMAQTGNFGNLIGPPLLALIAGVAADFGVTIFLVLCYTLGFCGHVWLSGRRQEAK